MSNYIAERLVRNRIKRLHEAGAPIGYARKVEKILNYRLGNYETGVTVEDIEILSQTSSTVTMKVEYSVDLRIPTYEDEDGRIQYEETQEFREQTMTLDLKELSESKKVSMTIQDDEGTIEELLDVLRSYTTSGHSFSVVVDPDNRDYTKTFYLDGDGTDKLSDLDVGEEEEES